MNIVYFIPHLKNISGMERVICVKANYMADILGYNVTILLLTVNMIVLLHLISVRR